MTQRTVDDATLAAFLDGSLSAAEREAVVRQLAADPETYRALREAADVVAALAEDQKRREPALAFRHRRSTWRRGLSYAAPFVAAAGIATAVFVRGRGDVSSFVDGALNPPVAGAGQLAATFGSTWDAPGWPVVRGADPTASVGGAARLGARYVQLVAGMRARDSLAVQATLIDARELLRSNAGSAPVEQRLLNLARSETRFPSALAGQLRTASGNVAAFDVGAWLETARLAALWRDPRFLTARPDPRELLSRMANDLEAQALPPSWHSTLAGLRRIHATTSTDWETVAPLVIATIATLPR